MTLFPQVSPTHCAHLFPPPYAPHAPPISFFSILPPAQYWVRNTDHAAPHYVTFSIPCHLVRLRPKYSPHHPILASLINDSHGQKIAFACGTDKFITVFTSVRQWLLLHAKLMHSISSKFFFSSVIFQQSILEIQGLKISQTTSSLKQQSVCFFGRRLC
jgi:hypothetical protein